VRAFRDDSVYHVDGSVDPKRDIDLINSELVLNDLIFIEKRLERLDKDIKKSSDAAAKKDRELLLKLKAHLEKELPIRLLELDAEERKAIAHYPFITLKEMIIVLNVSEDDIKNTDLADRFRNDYKIFKIDLMQVSAKVEAEIALLETDEERRAFLEGLGIRESAVSALTQVCIKALDLISFFTVESDEVRQWTIRKGSLAHEAAGAIHSDLEKGFIRAEVIRYPDLEALGSEEKVREAGKLYIKGKDYIVEDGDIINIRFNV
jgi:GTP-binding protein YchF